MNQLSEYDIRQAFSILGDSCSCLSLDSEAEMGIDFNPEHMMIQREILDRMSFRAQLILWKFVIGEDLWTQQAIRKRCRRDKWKYRNIDSALREVREALTEMSHYSREPKVIFLNPGQNNI